MRIQRFVLLFILLVLAFGALLNLAYLWMQSSNPSDTTFPESLTVYWIGRAAAGEGIYRDYHQPPFNVTQYPPGYYWMMGGVQRVLHLTADSTAVAGRRIMLLFALLIAGMVVWDGRNAGMKPALAGALFFLGAAALWPWGCTNRPDLPGAVLALAGYLLYTRSSGHARRAFAVLFLVLAIFTKQSLVAAPAAIFLHRLMERDRKGAAMFLLKFLAPVAAIAGLLQWFTGGLFLTNVMGINRSPLIYDNLATTTSTFLQTATLPLLLAVAGILHRKWRHSDSVYFILSMAWAVAMASKWGSNVNYFLEPLAVGCLLIPAGIRLFLDRLDGSGAPLVAAAVLVATFPQIHARMAAIRMLEFPSQGAIRDFVQHTDRPILTDTPRLGLWHAAPFMLDPFPLMYLEERGRWSSETAVRMARARAFGAVILSASLDRQANRQWNSRFPPALLREIQAGYGLAQRLDGYYVYLPKEAIPGNPP